MGGVQVYCLKDLRSLEINGSTPAEYRAYVPSDPEVRALLSRDRAHLDDPYKAAIVDTLIITMKGVAVRSPTPFPRFPNCTASLHTTHVCIATLKHRHVAAICGAQRSVLLSQYDFKAVFPSCRLECRTQASAPHHCSLCITTGPATAIIDVVITSSHSGFVANDLCKHANCCGK